MKYEITLFVNGSADSRRKKAREYRVSLGITAGKDEHGRF